MVHQEADADEVRSAKGLLADGRSIHGLKAALYYSKKNLLRVMFVKDKVAGHLDWVKTTPVDRADPTKPGSVQ